MLWPEFADHRLHTGVQVIVNADMKMIRGIVRSPEKSRCPYCMCPYEQRGCFDHPPWPEAPSGRSVPMSKIYLDIAPHCLMRMVDGVLSSVCERLSVYEKMVTRLNECFRKVHIPVKFREVARGVRHDKISGPVAKQFLGERFSWAECLDELLPESDVLEALEQFWSRFRELYGEAVENVPRNAEFCEKFRARALEMASWWSKLAVFHFPWYLHCFVYHVPDMMRRLGALGYSMVQVCQEGVEARMRSLKEAFSHSLQGAAIGSVPPDLFHVESDVRREYRLRVCEKSVKQESGRKRKGGWQGHQKRRQRVCV